MAPEPTSRSGSRAPWPRASIFAFLLTKSLHRWLPAKPPFQHYCQQRASRGGSRAPGPKPGQETASAFLAESHLSAFQRRLPSPLAPRLQILGHGARKPTLKAWGQACGQRAREPPLDDFFVCKNLKLFDKKSPHFFDKKPPQVAPDPLGPKPGQELPPTKSLDREPPAFLQTKSLAPSHQCFSLLSQAGSERFSFFADKKPPKVVPKLPGSAGATFATFLPTNSVKASWRRKSRCSQAWPQAALLPTKKVSGGFRTPAPSRQGASVSAFFADTVSKSLRTSKPGREPPFQHFCPSSSQARSHRSEPPSQRFGRQKAPPFRPFRRQKASRGGSRASWPHARLPPLQNFCQQKSLQRLLQSPLAPPRFSIFADKKTPKIGFQDCQFL